MENPMNRITGLVIAGFVLMLGVTPSWGGPPNPTASDAKGNTAGGTAALQNVTNGSFNTAFGDNALPADTDGSFNTACGVNALSSNTTGSSNTASGYVALSANTTGDFNTAVGSQALFQNTTGNYNTAIGVLALGLNVDGSQNTAIGIQALHQSTGKMNIAIGDNAGSALTAGKRNIYLGHPGAESESKTMRLGDGQTKTFIAGVTTAAVTGTNVVINASGQLGVPLSSARYKRDIETMGARSEGVLKLRPVTFVYKQDGSGVRQYGLIAEEVAAVYPELVTHTATGEVQAVRYQELIPMLVNELQRQQKELAELRILVGQMRGGGAQR
jgi:hypothetical protein